MNMREKIARAIDPGAFAAWQIAYDYEIRQSGNEEEARKFADWGHSLKSAYERADAVLDALMEPTEEMMDAGYGGHYRLDTTLGRERALADATSFIRAAKEGK